MTNILLALIVGYIIGKARHYYKNRVQCVNCGKHNTYESAAGFGGVKGSVCNFAVKHWEGHVCKDCDKITSVNMTLVK